MGSKNDCLGFHYKLGSREVWSLGLLSIAFFCCCVCDIYSGYTPSQCDMRPERVTVQRGATSVKQVLLDWCRNRVNGYKVSRPTDLP